MEYEGLSLTAKERLENELECICQDVAECMLQSARAGGERITKNSFVYSVDTEVDSALGREARGPGKLAAESYFGHLLANHPDLCVRPSLEAPVRRRSAKRRRS